MSTALLQRAGLRWWSESELAHRRVSEETLYRVISQALRDVNSAWNFRRIEAPMLLPSSMISDAYDGDDVFFLEREAMGERMVLRPETTGGSYKAAVNILDSLGLKKLPLCVWQVGKSFRVEKSDGASASKLRYNEFTQAEWQCIYREDTKADYRAAVLVDLTEALGWLTGCETRVVPSDRLPSYSLETLDVEVYRPGSSEDGTWTEVCSVSLRTDFVYEKSPNPLRVLEVAVGLDRVVDIAAETITLPLGGL